MAFFGVDFILQKFCPCKKNDKYQVWIQGYTCGSVFLVSYASARKYFIILRKRQEHILVTIITKYEIISGATKHTTIYHLYVLYISHIHIYFVLSYIYVLYLRGHYAESFVYFSHLVSSCLYHACDQVFFKIIIITLTIIVQIMPLRTLQDKYNISCVFR